MGWRRNLVPGHFILSEFSSALSIHKFRLNLNADAEPCVYLEIKSGSDGLKKGSAFGGSLFLLWMTVAIAGD
jgi:hypothetical protein